MKLDCIMEVRGKTSKKFDSGIKNYINLEDKEGLSHKFPIADDCDCSSLEKGDQIEATLEYSEEYKSFKLVSWQK